MIVSVLASGSVTLCRVLHLSSPVKTLRRRCRRWMSVDLMIPGPW